MRLDELEYGMRIRSQFKTALERQIGEAVVISREKSSGTTLLNSKDEYNRCKIQRIETRPNKSQYIETLIENENENLIKEGLKEINKVKRSRQKTKRENKQKKKVVSVDIVENVTIDNVEKDVEEKVNSVTETSDVCGKNVNSVDSIKRIKLEADIIKMNSDIECLANKSKKKKKVSRTLKSARNKIGHYYSETENETNKISEFTYSLNDYETPVNNIEVIGKKIQLRL